VPTKSSGRWGTGDIATWDIGLGTLSSNGGFCGGGGTDIDVVGTVSVGWVPCTAAALGSGTLDSASERSVFPAGGSGSNSRFV